MFYQGGTIDHCTHVTVPVAESSAGIEYNASCTAGMDLAHFRILNNEFLRNYPYVVP